MQVKRRREEKLFWKDNGSIQRIISNKSDVGTLDRSNKKQEQEQRRIQRNKTRNNTTKNRAKHTAD